MFDLNSLFCLVSFIYYFVVFFGGLLIVSFVISGFLAIVVNEIKLLSISFWCAVHFLGVGWSVVWLPSRI